MLRELVKEYVITINTSRRDEKMKRCRKLVAMFLVTFVITSFFVSCCPDNESTYLQFGNLNHDSVNVSSAWTQLITTSGTHSFTKSRDETKIEVHVNSRFSGGTFNGALGIRFQVRIDGNPPDYGNDGAINTTSTSDFLSMYAVFENLTAGSHTVSLWAKTSPNGSSSAAVFADPGDWGGKIIVKEGS